ncbi:pyridoxamine 5'-phosphate oxidase-domain-containing protein [Durotheca rogersii]|uniref:pyridoxamine 5'-phosphate oxidase-domain-containing protein n=1 Tax=Durotheca rogersii TaxID=419775 RepID=UPI00222046B3|nr:pyridoxamine 5'-phosphate oxidase-domain-containing protein [Durotheca rogersii]KAI5860655.1 pyridoxamine 5'-phosphate oxidase-domain-containing protein [Durotheca rogersii]
MRFSSSLSLGLLAAPSVAELAPEPQYILNNPPASESAQRIPTSYESAVLGRRILALSPLGTVATVFPDSPGGHNTPVGLGGVPLGLLEYVADCEEEGNPTFLAIKIGTSFRNVESGSNISLAQQWTPPYPPDKRIKSTTSFWDWLLGRDEKPKEPVPYSAVNLPRYSLLGYLEKIDAPVSADLEACYVATHPDAKYWLPGNPIHTSEFVRLVVTQVYWIGGFGDRAYIGWIPVDEWKSITREEWEDVRLPGEKKGWDEWSVSADL